MSGSGKNHVVNSVHDLKEVLDETHRSPDLRLGEIFVAEKLVSREQLHEALVRQKHSKGKHLGQILVDMQLVSQEEVNVALAKKLGIPFLNLQGSICPRKCSRVCPPTWPFNITWCPWAR